MLFNQELCLSESISLFGLLCNHISQRNPLGIYVEDGIRIISICALKNRHELTGDDQQRASEELTKIMPYIRLILVQSPLGYG